MSVGSSFLLPSGAPWHTVRAVPHLVPTESHRLVPTLWLLQTSLCDICVQVLWECNFSWTHKEDEFLRIVLSRPEGSNPYKLHILWVHLYQIIGRMELQEWRPHYWQVGTEDGVEVGEGGRWALKDLHMGAFWYNDVLETLNASSSFTDSEKTPMFKKGYILLLFFFNKRENTTWLLIKKYLGTPLGISFLKWDVLSCFILF